MNTEHWQENSLILENIYFFFSNVVHSEKKVPAIFNIIKFIDLVDIPYMYMAKL